MIRNARIGTAVNTFLTNDGSRRIAATVADGLRDSTYSIHAFVQDELSDNHRTSRKSSCLCR